MTTPFWCVAATFVGIMVPKLIAAAAMAKMPGGYDNHTPRVQEAQLQGWGGRAIAAHLNSMEAFPPFAAAVIIAHLVGLDPYRATVLSLVHVVARVVYVVLYVVDFDYLRTMVWTIGWLATLALFVLSGLQAGAQ